MPRSHLYIFLLVLLFSCGLYSWPSGVEAYNLKDILKVDVVGDAFGSPVAQKDFLYYYKMATLFTRYGNKKDRTDDDIRQEAWQNLIFVNEARRLGLLVPKEELQQELKSLLSQKDVVYGSDQYPLWVAANFGESPEIFERRIEDLMLINQLMKLKMDVPVTVSDEEVKENHFNQYSSFMSEYIMWPDAAQASQFAAQCRKDPLLWKKTWDAKISLGQKGAAWINIMSLSALIDLWKIPKEDAYRILNSKPGDFIPAKNIYGDAVFRLLDTQKADLQSYTADKLEKDREKMIAYKKHQIAQNYFDDLFKRANFHDYLKDKEDAQMKAGMKDKSLIAIQTNQGTIEVRLFPDLAPLACENFIGLVEKGFYNGITFHRVIKGFMIQAGDPTGTGNGGDTIWGGKAFANETSDKVTFDKPGILAMANAGGTNTNTSQFFITVGPQPGLNGHYTIFGQVVSGMDVVNKIDAAATDANDKPKQAQTISKAYVELK